MISATAIDPRLSWQCRRGMLELDELLQMFLDRGYCAATPEVQSAFQRLLTLSDQALFSFFFGGEIPADPQILHVVQQIRQSVGS